MYVQIFDGRHQFYMEDDYQLIATIGLELLSPISLSIGSRATRDGAGSSSRMPTVLACTEAG